MPLVLHVPHASRRIPPEVRPTLVLDDAALEAELLRMTDAYTDELFDGPAVACRVVYPVSRLIVDPERFPDDADEPMAARGMGAVYTRTSEGAALRRPVDDETRSRLLAAYYEPHHRRLDEAVAATLARHGRCLLVDCHSFPSVPLPCDLDQERPRPAICVGTDPVHSPRRLVDAAVEFFRREGLTTLVDRPYAGTLIPAPWYRRDSRVHGIMIEVSRALYMDEATGRRNGSFGGVAGMLGSLLSRLEEVHAQDVVAS